MTSPLRLAIGDSPLGRLLVATSPAGLCAVLPGDADDCLLEALRAIPCGRNVTYGQLAATLGAPRATRAVAAAVGANALAVVVPCHRVGSADGGLGGFRWGLARKQALRAREAQLV